MKNKKQEILEIIDGFKNLTHKIKEDNDNIKQRIKNKDEIIASCKAEYQKLYAEYEKLESEYNELKSYILKQQEQQEQQEQQQQQQPKKQKIYIKKRKHYLIQSDSEETENDDDDDDYQNDNLQYVKVKKKRIKNRPRKKINKGIMEYINDN